jgi:hypothetical protein
MIPPQVPASALDGGNVSLELNKRNAIVGVVEFIECGRIKQPVDAV